MGKFAVRIQIYTYTGGNYATAGLGLDNSQMGDIVVGNREIYANPSYSIPVAIRINSNGDLLWENDFTVQREQRQLTVYGNNLTSVIQINGTGLVACGAYESLDDAKQF